MICKQTIMTIYFYSTPEKPYGCFSSAIRFCENESHLMAEV